MKPKEYNIKLRIRSKEKTKPQIIFDEDDVLVDEELINMNELQDYFIPIDLSNLSEKEKKKFDEHLIEMFEQKSQDLLIKGLNHYSIKEKEILRRKEPIKQGMRKERNRRKSLKNYIHQSQCKICQKCIHYNQKEEFCNTNDCRVEAWQDGWILFLYDLKDIEFIKKAYKIQIKKLKQKNYRAWKNRNNWKYYHTNSFQKAKWKVKWKLHRIWLHIKKFNRSEKEINVPEKSKLEKAKEKTHQ